MLLRLRYRMPPLFIVGNVAIWLGGGFTIHFGSAPVSAGGYLNFSRTWRPSGLPDVLCARVDLFVLF